MASTAPTQLPAYIALRYEENGVFDKFASAAEHAAEQTKKRFTQAFRETESLITGSLGRAGSQMGKLDLGLGDMRQQAADIRLYRDALDEVSRAAAELARETGDTSTRTREYLQALSSQRAEADRALAVADAQVTTYTRLQQAMDGAASESSRLAQSQREAVAANQQLQKELAQEANALRQALDPSLAIQQKFDAELDRADKLLKAGAISTREYAQAQELARQNLSQGYSALFEADEATKRLSASNDRAADSSGRHRAAVQNLSYQLQDVMVQAQMGTSWFTILAQQGGQIAGALSEIMAASAPASRSISQTGDAAEGAGSDIQDLGDRAVDLAGRVENTGTRMGRFASFMAGPWGAAMVVGAAVLAPLVAKLFDSSDAADEADKAHETLVQRLNIQKHTLEEVTKAMKEYIAQQVQTRDSALDTAAAIAKQTKADLEAALAIRQKIKASIGAAIASEEANVGQGSVPGAVQAGGSLRLADLRRQMAENDAQLKTLTEGAEEAIYGVASAMADLNADPTKRIAEGFAQLRKEARNSITDVTALTTRLTDLNKQEKSALEAIRESKKVTSGPSASAQANLGDMVALIKDLFPGATITSTTGGKHVKGSDHYAGRALDFVPGGGMGRYTTDEVEQILRDAGVDIRRNATGTQQLFGPGRAAKTPGDHNDHFHVAWQGSVPDPAKVQAATQKAQELLQRFGERSAESIARVNERFDEQPRLIDQAAQATRQLDAVIKDLAMRQPPGFEKMIADAQAAKDTVQDALVRPFRELTEDSQRRLQMQELLAKGQQDEAAILQEIWRIEETLGSEEELRSKIQALNTAGKEEEALVLQRILDMYPDLKRGVADTLREEQRRTRELERQRALFEAQLDVIDQARASLTDLLTGRSSNFFKDVRQSLQDLQGKRLFDSLFGDLFQQLEDELRGQSPLGRESQRFADELSVATDAVERFASGIAGGTVRGAANDNGVTSGVDATFAAMFDQILSGRSVGWDGGLNPPGAISVAANTGDVIEVVAKRPTDISGRSVTAIATKIAGAVVTPFEKALGDAFGTEFAQMLGGVMKGALSGYLTGGTTGGILGGLKGIVDQTGIFGGSAGGVSGALGQAGSGAATGTMAAGIMKSLGLKTSTTGAQIGGAIGSFVPIPGGEIIGSIAGGLLGGLFKSNRTAGVVLTGNNPGVVGGKDTGNYGTATGLGDSVLSGLNNIVEQLGGTIGNFMVTIGTRGDEYRVNPNGNSLKIDQGAISFGDDAEAAVAFAIKNAIEDGAIKGMRASTLNIIKAGKDLDKALQDAVDWEGAFKQLAKYKDPIGSAIAELNDEFERLIAIGKAGSASAEEMAQLEELYGIKRNEIIKEQAEALVGSLKGLLSDLTTGDNGLSLRDRRGAALSEYEALKARVAAGDTTAYDDYTNAAQNLLGIERDLYGSQQEYFDRLNEIIDLTKTRIDKETNVISIGEGRDSPFDASGAVNKSIQSQTDMQQSQLSAVNENLGRALSLLSQIASNGGASSAGSPRLAFDSYF